jgi:hypothetical protein
MKSGYTGYTFWAFRGITKAVGGLKRLKAEDHVTIEETRACGNILSKISGLENGGVKVPLSPP